jgi:hypothetical protein
MYTEKEDGENQNSEEEKQQKTARPPPIILTNLIKLQAELKGLVQGSFNFRNTHNGTRVTTTEMANYSVIGAHFESKKLNYFTFHHKSEKPIKAVIQHLRIDTPEVDISGGLVNFGSDVISVKQMTSSHISPERVSKQANTTLFMITMKRKAKS